MTTPTLFDAMRPAPLIPVDLSNLSIDERFEMFHAANPDVYRNLCQLARDLTSRGRERIGMKMLFEVLRWHFWMATDDPTSDYKLNNDLTSRYARLIMQQEEDLADVFETRELRS